MFCYLLNRSFLWRNSNLTEGQRNVRILFVGLILYLVLHSIAYSYKETSAIFKFINGYFMFIIIADIILCACLYKMYYGRSIVNELNGHETDHYDEKAHKYHPLGKDNNANSLDLINTRIDLLNKRIDDLIKNNSTNPVDEIKNNSTSQFTPLSE